VYDLIVLGSGPAGEKGAAQAAWFGKRVALIEREPVLGGACVNTGTIPSKTLRESALHLSGFRQRGFRDAVQVRMHDHITLSDFMHRKNVVVQNEWQLIEESLQRHRVDRFHGSARFVSPHEVQVGDRTLNADIVLIATGSSPHRPDHVPFDDRNVLDSDTILQIDHIPRSLAVVGAGVIGCEYASMFAALGMEVNLIDGRTSLLPFVDREVIGVLLDEMQTRLGVKLHLGCDVASIVVNAVGDVTLNLKDGTVICADTVLYAAGRSSNTADLHLDNAGVKTGARGVIEVNEHFQTNVPHIYAAGDVVGFPALASTSMLPYGIYTIPEVSTIGMSEQQCIDAKTDYETGRASYRDNARGQIIGDTKGLIKLVFDPNTLLLLGVHIVGENASELLHIGMIVMQSGGTINAFIDCVFNFPTLSEAYKYAAYDGLGNVARRKKEMR
jgi:NAD(P) transhydrogenase